MNLRHLKLESEDDNAWTVKDMRDGKVFPVVKKGVGKATHDAIIQHFTDGGEVEQAPQKLEEVTDAQSAQLRGQPLQLLQDTKDRLPLTWGQPIDQRLEILRRQLHHAQATSGPGEPALREAYQLALLERQPLASMEYVQQLNTAAKQKADTDALNALIDNQTAMGHRTNQIPMGMADGGFVPENKTDTTSDLLRAAASMALPGFLPPRGVVEAAPVVAQKLAGSAVGSVYGEPTPAPAPPAAAPVEAAPAQAQPMPPAVQPIRPPAPAGSVGEREMIDAERKRASMAEQVGAEQLAIQQRAEQERLAAGQAWQQRWQENQARADGLMNKLASGEVDPHQWWNNRGLGQKVAASIALVLGSIGQAFGGGPNLALQAIEKEIDRDIDGQKTNLGKKQNLLSHYLQQGHDIQQAHQMAKADMMDAYAGQMQQVASKYYGQEHQVNAQQNIAKIRQASAAARASAAQQGFKNQIDAIEARAKLATALNASQSQNKIPAKEAADIGGFESASGQMDALLEARKAKIGLGSSVTQFIPGTSAASYKDDKKVAAQAVGTILEGGKLSDRDKPFYESLMPDETDSDERAANKVEIVKQMLARKAKENVKALGKSGYNTSGLQDVANAPTSQREQRVQMLQWATANKDSPNTKTSAKAKEMLELLGVK